MIRASISSRAIAPHASPTALVAVGDIGGYGGGGDRGPAPDARGPPPGRKRLSAGPIRWRFLPSGLRTAVRLGVPLSPSLTSKTPRPRGRFTGLPEKSNFGWAPSAR